MTPEQKARDLLEACGVENAQSFSAGDVVALANYINSHETHYGEETLSKVYEGLRAAGLSSGQCVNAVDAMQNRGILFRERIKQ